FERLHGYVDTVQRAHVRNEVFIGDAHATADIDDRHRVGVPEMPVANVEQVRRFASREVSDTLTRERDRLVDRVFVRVGVRIEVGHRGDAVDAPASRNRSSCWWVIPSPRAWVKAR